VASGLFNTTQQIGGAVGLTVLSAFATARTRNLAGVGRTAPSALLGGYHLAFLIAAGFVTFAFFIGAAMLHGAPAQGGPAAPASDAPEAAGQDVAVS
jgi:hypothetical protein